MTDRTERVDSSPLPPLDAEPGPMPQLSAAESDAIAWGAVSRWAAGLPGVEPADGGVGPARPLSTQSAEHLAQRVVALRSARLRSYRLQPWATKAAIALLACAITAATFAAYRLRPSAPQAPATKTVATASPLTPAPDISVPKLSTPSAQVHVPAPQPSSDASSPKPRAAAEETIPPEELLARANALRSQRRWAAAERLYRQALGSGANDPQRYVALVAAASINLQHLDKPARALASYQSALALIPNGALSEEAHFGIAECQRALGDRTLEQRALQQFSAEHPDSPMIDAVQKRRAELDSH